MVVYDIVDHFTIGWLPGPKSMLCDNKLKVFYLDSVLSSSPFLMME